MNTEYQTISRRDKKGFLSDQCKEIQQNRIGKTRDLFKKIRITREHFMLGTIQDRNSLDLTEAENTKRWNDTQKNYTKKVLKTQITTMV